MAYEVIDFFDSSDGTRQVPNAVVALEACVATIRRQSWPQIEDEAGRRVSLAQLLEAAGAEATEPAALGRLTDTLSRYVEFQRDDAWMRADGMRQVLTSANREQELLRYLPDVEADDARSWDADELKRLHPIVIGQGAWREAGRSWAWHFEVPIPEPVISHLAQRLGRRMSANELRAGVREGLKKVAERHRTERVVSTGHARVPRAASMAEGRRQGVRRREASP